MKALLLILACAGTTGQAAVLTEEQAKATDPGWLRFIEACDTYHTLNLPLAPAFWTGRQFEPKHGLTLQQVDQFLESDCKSYNDSRNSPEKLAAFVPKLHAVSAAVTETRALALQAESELDRAYRGLRERYLRLGANPRESECYLYVEQRLGHVLARNRELLERTRKIERLCPVSASKEPMPAAKLPSGQGAPAARAGKDQSAPPSASGLTGTGRAISEAKTAAAIVAQPR